MFGHYSVARLQQEEFYKRVIAQRSEAHKLRAELSAAQEQAIAFKEFHNSTKAHLEHQNEVARLPQLQLLHVDI